MSLFRSIPSIHGLAENLELIKYPPSVRLSASRKAVQKFRRLAGEGTSFSQKEILEEAVFQAKSLFDSSLKRVINLSGIILHTGLGRALLAEPACQKVQELTRAYCSLEYDLHENRRSNRQNHVRELLIELTGAEDALVVNNCAAAVFLTLQGLCHGREVMISNGHMVEIGGSFRVPDIVKQAGCRLVGVGCTNKTRIKDYEEAITENSVAILRCHPSNFQVVGFTEEPSTDEIISLCKESNLLFMDDIGNGCLTDVLKFGLYKERSLIDSLQAGADVVLSSGDKLLGGPQSGLILGRKELLNQLKRHPIARVVRVDKFTIGALSETLRLYLEGREAEIPVWQCLAKPLKQLKKEAQILARAYPFDSKVLPSKTEVGSGSLPGNDVPTWCAVLKSECVESLAHSLRMSEPAVLGRIHRDKLWLDPRTLQKGELKLVVRILESIPKI